MIIRAILALSLAASPGWAAKKKAAKSAPKGSAAEVNRVLADYRSAQAIKAKIKKTVVQEAMGSETKGEGDFYFSKGKLRMDMISPEKSVLVYDGKIVWFESRIESLDGKGETIQVTKMKTGKLKKTDSLMATLFEEKDITKTFKFIGTKDEKGVRLYDFKPIDKNKTEVQYLQIGLKDKNVERVVYEDQVENKVSVVFSDLVKGKVPPEKFHYVPPKNAEITDI
jgi:outer membrane lipoprotein-sorting protein